MAPPELMTSEPTLGRRREPRLRVRLEVRLITLDGTSRTVMADLSRSGARLTGHLPLLRTGQQAVIQWHEFEAFGLVAWSKPDQCGFAFDEPLAPTVLSRTRQLFDQAPLGSERDRARMTARAFVQGKMRL